MPLFNDFKILVEILFGPSLLSGFKAKEFEALVFSVGLIKIDSIFKSRRQSQYFFGKTDGKLNIYKNFS